MATTENIIGAVTSLLSKEKCFFFFSSEFVYLLCSANYSRTSCENNVIFKKTPKLKLTLSQYNDKALRTFKPDAFKLM